MGIMIGIFFLLFIAMFFVTKQCKGKPKIILAGLIALIACYFVMLSIDMNMVNSFRKPIFTKHIDKMEGDIGATQRHVGLGYKVDIEYFDNGEMESVTMYMFGKVIAASIT